MSKKDIPYHALEMATTRHAEKVAVSFLEILKDMKQYNEGTKTPSWITTSPSVNEVSYLRQMIDILEKCLNSDRRTNNAFMAHYYQVYTLSQTVMETEK